MDNERSDESTETETVLAQLRQLNEEAKGGNPKVLIRIRGLLDRYPQLWRHYGDVARHTESKWIDLAAGTDAVMRESLARMAEDQRTELLNEGDSSLERLLIDRVVISLLMVRFFDVALALSTEQPKTRVSLLERQLNRAQRRHTAAIKSLAEVRKLLPKPVS